MKRFKIQATLECPSDWDAVTVRRYIGRILISKEEKASLAVFPEEFVMPASGSYITVFGGDPDFKWDALVDRYEQKETPTPAADAEKDVVG